MLDYITPSEQPTTAQEDNLKREKEQYADQTERLLRRLIDGNFSITESELEIKGPWAKEVRKIINAFQDGYEQEVNEAKKQEAGKKAAESKFRELSRLNHDLIVVMSGGYTTELPGDIEPLLVDTPNGFPELPAVAQLPKEMGRNGCKWLDDCVDLLRTWSPRSYGGQYEGVALWMLSTVAARRIVVYKGKPHYTNMYIALVGETGQAKSFCAGIGEEILKEAGLGFLLGDDDTTPEKLLSDMGGAIPDYYGDLDSESKDELIHKLIFAGQRGWYYDEFSQLLRGMSAKNNINYKFHSILRRLDDTKRKFKSSTIGRGVDCIDNPYLVMLAVFTLSNMKPYARKDGEYWHDGFWARYAFITPPDDFETDLMKKSPPGKRPVPTHLTSVLRQWHGKLGIPPIQIELKRGKDGKETEQYARNCYGPFPEQECVITPEVERAYDNYEAALYEIMKRSEYKDLKGNYVRLLTFALRISMLFASLDNLNSREQPYIEMRHWAKAQEIVENWRRDLHSLYEQLNQKDPTEKRDTDWVSIQELILEVMKKNHDKYPSHWGFTPNEIRVNSRPFRKIVPRQFSDLFEDCIKSGDMIKAKDGEILYYRLTPKRGVAMPHEKMFVGRKHC